jgi:hypothetical protein
MLGIVLFSFCYPEGNFAVISQLCFRGSTGVAKSP